MGSVGIEGSMRAILGCGNGNHAMYAARAQKFWYTGSLPIYGGYLLTPFIVISLDLNPAGGMLATGIGDILARICELTVFRLEFSDCSHPFFLRELHCHLMPHDRVKTLCK